jgi:hypothetical protein
MSDDTAEVRAGYVAEINLDHGERAERAILHSREGNKVHLRAADPCDPGSTRVAVYEGEEIVVMEPITGTHTVRWFLGGWWVSVVT